MAGDGARRLPRARGGQEAEAASRLMDGLSIFGLLSVSAMLLFYALEPRGPHCVLAFAAACALSGAYGFLQGAWPFGFVETVWTAVALRRWTKVRSSP